MLVCLLCAANRLDKLIPFRSHRLGTKPYFILLSQVSPPSFSMFLPLLFVIGVQTLMAFVCRAIESFPFFLSLPIYSISCRRSPVEQPQLSDIELCDTVAARLGSYRAIKQVDFGTVTHYTDRKCRGGPSIRNLQHFNSNFIYLLLPTIANT